MNAVKAKPWAVLALISLALNLFLGGVLVGRLLRPDPPPRDVGPISLLRSHRDLDPDARNVVEKTRKRHHQDIRRSMRRAGEARRVAVEALCASDFDEARAREAFQAFREETNTAHDKMHEALIEAAREMTPEQRQQLRESLVRGRWDKRGREGRNGERIRLKGSKGPRPGEDR